MVRYEIGCPRSRPLLYALPSGSKFTHLTAWTLPSKGLIAETHVQRAARDSFGLQLSVLCKKDFKRSQVSNGYRLAKAISLAIARRIIAVMETASLLARSCN